MEIVTCRLTHLFPLTLFIEVALLADAPIQAGVGRDFLRVRGGPAPDDSSSILNILLVATLAIHSFVRTGLPGGPRRLHDVARGTESRVVFYVVIAAVTAPNHGDC